jgi:hypothetical protein
MTIVASGPLTLTAIQTEFGGSAPISISEYYSAHASLPSSGEIKFSDFYGLADSYTVTVTEGTYGANTYGFSVANAWLFAPTSAFGSRSPTTYKGTSILQIYWVGASNYMYFCVNGTYGKTALFANIQYQGLSKWTSGSANFFSTTGNQAGVSLWIWYGTGSGSFNGSGTSTCDLFD